MIIGTAGHIDHGKTALVHALTGVDTDRLPEEKRRGITIELGFAPLALPDGDVAGIVDVPGHEGFVRTMLAGATGVDVALLVIAADEGVMPQTREHLSILSLLGVPAGIVALTKCDLVDDEEWLELVRSDIRALLESTPFAGAPMIETSVVSGAGLAEIREALARVRAGLVQRDRADLFRMPIDRVFTVKGTGTVVTGTIWSGEVARDSALRIMPGDRSVRVRALQSHGAAAMTLGPGTRAAVALAGVEHDALARGASLVIGDAWTESRALRADVSLLDDAPHELRPRTRVRFHLGTTDVGARVIGRGGPLQPGEVRPVRLVLDDPVVARAGDRFVLRGTSPVVTIGGGIVTDPSPPFRRARPWPSAHAPLVDRLGWMLAESDREGLPIPSLRVRLGVSDAASRALVASLDPPPSALGNRLFPAGRVEALSAGIVRRTEEYHRKHPLEPGAPLQQIRSQADALGAVADEAVARAVAAGYVEVNSGVIAVKGWSPALTAEQSALLEQVRERLDTAGPEPPSIAELAGPGGGDATIQALLRILERRGIVVQVEGDRFYSARALEALIERMGKGMTAGREYAPAELREVLGLSRKFLIPFLEYCDRKGVTERRDGGRVWQGR